MSVTEPQLYPLRCHTCGTIMGYTAQGTADLTLWCSEECRAVPVGQRNENNPRDEVMTEMNADGVLVSQLARTFGITRQAVTQVLDRRLGRRRATLWEPPSKEEVVAAKAVVIPTHKRRGRVR